MKYYTLYTNQYIFVCFKQNKIPNFAELQLLHQISFKYKVEKNMYQLKQPLA